ncbi:hypothetical protein VitviT2T_029788 [Vitis vinifera]|nr:hypothetical protein VitviT2T_029788 [Vitis vinifera]
MWVLVMFQFRYIFYLLSLTRFQGDLSPNIFFSHPVRMESEPPFGEFVNSVFGNIVEQEETEAKFDVDECELPLIDLGHLNLGNLEHEECKRKICEASTEWGFFQIVNHGVSKEILSRIHREQVELFRQPFQIKTNEKLLNLSSGCYRWGTQTAITQKQFAWSEAFHIPLSTIFQLSEFEGLRSSLQEFAIKASDLAQQIAKILAENLGCKSTFFFKNCLPSSCYIRMNRYPACPVSSKVFGLIPHTDSDFLTVLHQDQVGGLQLLKDGKWIRVKPNPDALVINIGDLFQAWSNGVYKSLEHRVVANHEIERFSFAYFLCPSHDTVIQSCCEPSIYRKFSFREYRQQVEEDVKTTGDKVGLSRFRR